MQATKENQVYQKNNSYRYYTFLVMLYMTMLIATSITVFRLIEVKHVVQPGGTIIFPFTYVLGDVIAEVYGYQQSAKLVRSAFFCLIIFTLLLNFINHFPAPNFWLLKKSYDDIISLLMRSVLNGTIGVFVSSFVTIYLLTKWKVTLQGRMFWLRSTASSAIGEAILTILAFVIAFWGSVPNHELSEMILSAWLFKVAFSTLASFPANLVTYFLKKHENLS